MQADFCPSRILSDPSSTLGACIGLFFLSVAHVILRTGICIVDRRRLSGHSDTMEYHSLANKEQHRSQSPPPYPGTHPVPAFRWLVDAPRGLLEGFTTAIGYFLVSRVSITNNTQLIEHNLSVCACRCWQSC